MRSPLMDDLTALDPARHLRAPGRAEDTALQGILAADRHAPDGYRPARRPAHPAALAGTAAAGVAAVAVGVTWSSTLWATPAYASWTPVPQPVDASQAVAQTDECPTTVPAITAAPGEPRLEGVPVEPVLAESRGDYTYVVLAGGGAVADCFVTTVDGEQDVYSSQAAGAEVATPGSREVAVAGSGTASWSQGATGEGAVTSAFGRVGDEVAAVTVTRTDGEIVEATVSDGWFALWAPGESAFSQAAQVTFTDGTTAEIRLT